MSDMGVGTEQEKNHHTPDKSLEHEAKISNLLNVIEQAMEKVAVAPEVQQEALRMISNAASQAAMVDTAQLEALVRSAEARGKMFAEVLRLAETAEERQQILSDFIRADEQDRREREEIGERSTNTQRGIAKTGAGMLRVVVVGACVVAVMYFGSRQR